jgi:RNA polymerase-binding transcription factor DksA
MRPTPEQLRHHEDGKCKRCNGAIGDVRLKLMPTAELCATCQKADDAQAILRRA